MQRMQLTLHELDYLISLLKEWDEELLSLFNIPKSLLPTVLDNCAPFWVTDLEIFAHEMAITAMIGDQQAACYRTSLHFTQAWLKVLTYGTGCFMLLNTGDQMIHSRNRLISTVVYRLDNKVTYGLEGSIFVAGAVVKWLRDTLQIIKNPKDTQQMASSVEDTDGVYFVPAFTGLGGALLLGP